MCNCFTVFMMRALSAVLAIVGMGLTGAGCYYAVVYKSL